MEEYHLFFFIITYFNAVFIVVTNSLVITLTCKSADIRKASSTRYLLSLTIASLCAGLFVPFAAFSHKVEDEQMILCKIYHYFIHLVITAQVYSLVAIAYHRHHVMRSTFAIVTPVQRSTQRTPPPLPQGGKVKNGAIICVVWFLSAVYSVLDIVTFPQPDVDAKYRKENTHSGKCNLKGHIMALRLLDMIVLFFLPVILIIFFYMSLLLRLRRSKTNVASSAKITYHKRVLATCLGLIVVFCMCTMPLILLETTLLIRKTPFEEKRTLRDAFSFFYHFQFGLNALLYALCNDRYKKAASSMLDNMRCFKCHRKDASGSEVYGHGNTMTLQNS